MTARKVDLSIFSGPILDQGPLGTCVENALSAILTIEMNQASHHMTPISRLQSYYDMRSLYARVNNTPISDGGSITSVVLSNAQSIGLAPETDWGYDTSSWAVKPPPQTYIDAATHKLMGASFLNSQSVEQIKGAIIDGDPVLMSLNFRSWLGEMHGPLSTMAVSSPYGELLGVHAVAVVGFSDNYNAGKGAFIIQNSWGPQYGDAGYSIVPYDFVRGTTEVKEAVVLNGFDGVDLKHTPAREDVSELYACVLNRAPEKDGMFWWAPNVDAGVPLSNLADAMMHSPEGKLLFPEAATSKQVVETMYNQVLGRHADVAGLNGWSALIDQGWSRGQVITSLMTVIDEYTGADPSTQKEAQRYDNRSDMGEYYALALQSNNYPHAKAVLDTLTYDPSTLDAAKVTLIGQMIADHSIVFS